MKFKIGQRVIVLRKADEFERKGIGWTCDMDDSIGLRFSIDSISPENGSIKHYHSYHLSNGWWYPECVLVLDSNYKIPHWTKIQSNYKI